MKILITGPESSGKTTLARDLATTLSGQYVPEFAREFLNGRKVTSLEDLDYILGQQLGQEQSGKLDKQQILVCDTGPLVIYVWALEKFGQVTPTMQATVEGMDYDLIFLCYPDLPWAPDPLREHPAKKDRLRLFHRYKEMLDEYHYPHAVIRGTDRLGAATSHPVLQVKS